MKKNKAQPQENIWDQPESTIVEDKVTETFTEKVEEVIKPKQPQSLYANEYDLEGLMTDFPTAKELERFVYDETGIVLNLKGRANKLKYQVAMDVLNGQEVDSKFIGDDNPYIEKAEMIPTEELRPVPARSTLDLDQHLADYRQSAIEC